MHCSGAVCAATRLPPAALKRPCRPSELPFATTADAAPVESRVVGQERAVQALRFGIGIRRSGYNLFAIGPPGVGKQTLLRQLLGRQADAGALRDWCYVHDFADAERPRALELPAGKGTALQRDMERAIAELRVGMRAAFDSDEYRTRRQRVIDEYTERHREALSDVQARARQRDVAVMQTDTGIAIAPIRDGEALEPERFRELPEPERDRIHAEMERVSEELQRLMRTFHDWGHEQHERMQQLGREMAETTARRVLDGVRQAFSDVPAVVDYLAQVEADVVDRADEFLEAGADSVAAALRHALDRESSNGGAFRRYRINVLVDRGEQTGPPVIYEANPTYPNLLGRIEHESQLGALITNFTLIRPGAFHRAIGGYLILDALKVLQNPLAWDAVKRMVQAGEVRIEALGEALGLVSTVSLQPQPVPLGDTKVILVGERVLYYLLAALDPEFLELFKVVVDFEDSMDWRPESQQVYANLIAGLVAHERLRPFDRAAVARVIEHAARVAGDADKLSVHMRGVVDLLREADFWAGEQGRELVTAADVQRALDEQLERGGRVRDRLQEAIRRDDILVATAGESVGQVNGLSVFQLGERVFGHPTRITARTRLGTGKVIDIEREVALGGPIHSKGVLILGGFLGSRYAADVPLSLSATLVFEQSYASVEGDSASLAELCALLSSLAQAPVAQGLAVTGSVNQHGRVQSIGAVNDKIEGFFDVCRERGLTGAQGVIIPASNVKNLMLRDDVIAAVEQGRFSVHAVDDVDDALELLTGAPAADINARVEARLRELAEQARAFQPKPPP